MTPFRFLPGRAFHLACALLLTSFMATASSVVDIAGRKVDLPPRVQRVLLGEGRLFYAMSLLEGKQPFARIAGWQGDFRLLDIQGYAAYRQRFPQIDSIPLIGQTSEATISPEKVLTLKPDLAIFSISGHGPNLGSPLVDLLTRAGVPVVFVDFREKPLEHTVPSMRILGAALDRRNQAEAFIRFYEGKLALIRQRVARLPAQARPLVFTDVRADTFDNLMTAGKGSFGEMVEVAGGRNLGSSLLATPLGPVNIEQVLVSQPSYYLASGAAAPGSSKGLQLGAATERNAALASLQRVGSRTQLKGLPAARGAHVFAAWHMFYDMPQHIILIEALTKWLHPAQFSDIDPQRSWTEMHQRFGAMQPGGTYWLAKP